MLVLLILYRLLQHPWKKGRGAILLFCPRHHTEANKIHVTNNISTNKEESPDNLLWIGKVCHKIMHAIYVLLCQESTGKRSYTNCLLSSKFISSTLKYAPSEIIHLRQRIIQSYIHTTHALSPKGYWRTGHNCKCSRAQRLTVPSEARRSSR
jgi:hypothetical protein